MNISDDELERLALLNPAALRAELDRFQEKPPSSARDALMGMALLQIAIQVPKADSFRYFLSGYSYARTSRHPLVRRLAEEARARFDV